MKRTRKTGIKWLGMMILVFIALPAQAQLESSLSVNFKDSPLKGVLELIAAKTGLQLVLEQELGTNITLSQGNTTAQKLLDKISKEQQIEYFVSGTQLIVTKKRMGTIVGGISESFLIPIKYGSASDIYSKVVPVVSAEDRLISDERANNLVFIGSKRSYEKLMTLIKMFDAYPKQIMIEAQIVETSLQFMRSIGISMGDLSDRTLNNDSNLTGFSSTPGPVSPNFSMKAIMGRMGGRNLDVRLTAAEVNGDAKVISRPKVVTLNNRQARVTSGISYSIKTLTNSNASGGTSGGSSGSGTTNGVLTGGITTVNAGLSLDILPTLVGEDEVRLVVDINNSQPDSGSGVDGIPGILNNAASTAVIVKNGQTAVIAGLIKQTKSNSSSGVPILSDIPLIGNLFKSSSKEDRNNELVIFITPTIDDGKILINQKPTAELPAAVPPVAEAPVLTQPESAEPNRDVATTEEPKKQ